MKKLILLALLSIFFSLGNLFAKEETLSITDNDDNNEVYNLVVNVDDATQSLKNLYKDTFIDGKKIRRDVLNPDNLKTKDGVILEKRDNYNVLNLKSDNLDFDRGGKIIIDTLYNGVTGDRRTVDLDLSKDKNSWKLFKDKKAVSKFHVKVNKVIILGTVGIKTIVME
jgi:site-specific DNA-adenine methylase